MSRNFSLNKKHNEFSSVVPDMPKAVMVAIAMSAYANAAFRFPAGDDGEPCDVGSDQSLRRIAYEWKILHAAGIVPQPVSKDWVRYL